MTPARHGRTRAEPRHAASIYWKKAGRFLRAARQNLESGEFDPAVASAVNAVVNVTDAVCVHYLGLRSASEGHHEALTVLATVMEADPEVREALGRHLEKLLDVKSLAQYEARLMTRQEAGRAVEQAERAAAAVRGLAKRLGWGET